MSESIFKYLITIVVLVCITAIVITTVHALAPRTGTYFCQSTDSTAATSAFICHN